jgi:hypothetical protein
VDWLGQNPLPELADVLIEVAGKSYVKYVLAKFQKHGKLPSGLEAGWQ